MKVFYKSEISIENAITIFCSLLLFSFINLEITCRSDAYVFEAEKTKPILLRCKEYKLEDNMNIIDRTMAAQNFALGNIERQRCVKRISPDGNCLFRSISYCVYEDENYFSNVRKKIVEHVVMNWTDYADFIVGSGIYGRPINSVDAYESYMSKDKVWGAHVELVAATRVYQICLQIFTNRNNVHEFQRMGEEKHKIFALYYWGDGFIGHYSVVEDILVLNSTSVQPESPTRGKRTRDSTASRLTDIKYRRKRYRTAAQQQRKISVKEDTALQHLAKVST